MKRRAFILALGGAATWPLVARAQPAVPVIGFLNGSSPESLVDALAAFRAGLGESGYVEGRNVAIEFRWARGQYQRLPEMATELVGRRVAVIVAGGSIAAGFAAKAATATIPIVFSSGTDPVAVGLVPSLSRPGGNLTGAFILTAALEAKRLQLLHELVPTATRIAILANPNFPDADNQRRDLQVAAQAIGRQVVFLDASSERDIDTAFASSIQHRAGALLVASDPFLFSRRDQIVAMAARHAVPAVYQWRDFATAGGLMSYGTVLAEMYRPVGIYAGRILKGAKPSELPVQQSTKIELIINLKTAKALGLEVPVSLLGRADEVIE
ncbi:MAG: ABC transporter substrate-binding protein [Xanthobacteraceae bacterium]